MSHPTLRHIVARQFGVLTLQVELQASSSMRHFVKCFLCLDVVVCFCYYLLGIDAEFVSMHVVVTLSVAMISQRKYGLQWQRNWIQWPCVKLNSINRAAGSKLDLKYTYVASGPSLQVESKFSYALELVNLEQQAASSKLDNLRSYII